MAARRKSLYNLLFKDKVARVLLGLTKNRDYRHIRAISRWSDCEYAHTHRILNNLQKEGLVTSYKIGRKRIFVPTKKGELVARHIESIIEIDPEDD